MKLDRTHVSGRRDYSKRLWQLVVFERWHAHYLDGAGSLLPFDAPAVPSPASTRTA